ncbi:hypothetical protein [Xylophilus ampelinus]|uniref:Uncharacterized protein n=1 Tax=Xylophilus ampelinus TaxID=54067 RepID=A0A318SXI2_9BURK|nr:hypothetical protein [Xylophilus ampelinus]MCS4509258.1 hypothetical protein [Xylophilus ampelinus]PYE79717.1 hypothetical protein DFQ15_10136 [Xylophilus ampelinus]
MKIFGQPEFWVRLRDRRMTVGRHRIDASQAQARAPRFFCAVAHDRPRPPSRSAGPLFAAAGAPPRLKDVEIGDVIAFLHAPTDKDLQPAVDALTRSSPRGSVRPRP